MTLLTAKDLFSADLTVDVRYGTMESDIKGVLHEAPELGTGQWQKPAMDSPFRPGMAKYAWLWISRLDVAKPTTETAVTIKHSPDDQVVYRVQQVVPLRQADLWQLALATDVRRV
jgi:hypothetical protein